MSWKLKIPQATKKGYIEVGIKGAFDWAYPTSKLRRGRVQGGGLITPAICSEANNILIFDGMEEKPKTERPEGKGWCWDPEKEKWFRIRKLTPRECFRLMGVGESDIDKLMAIEYIPAKEGILVKQIISNSQLYKLAGNSIVVDVMVYMFENLFYPDSCKPTETKPVQLTFDW